MRSVAIPPLGRGSDAGFGRELPQGHDRLWFSSIFWIVLYLEQQPGAEAREALASEGGLARQSRTYLTLFSLIFVNEVKHVKCRTCFGRQLPQGHDRLRISYIFWIGLYLEHQPGAEAREALASEGGLARQSRTCLTLFRLIFLNEVKHVKCGHVLDDNCHKDTTDRELVAFFE